MSPLRLAGLILPLGFLVGCAISPKPDPGSPGRVVTSSASLDDRKVINQAEQNVYDTAHMNSADASAAPNQGIP